MKLGLVFIMIFNMSLCLKDYNGYIKKNGCNLNQDIYNEICNIKLKTSTNQNYTYYFFVSFYEKRDSNFLAITYDLKPPYVFPNRHNLGFIRCDTDYIIFSNKASRKIIKYFLRDLRLNKNFNALREHDKDEGLHIDGLVRHYYIDKQMKLTFKKATNELYLH